MARVFSGRFTAQTNEPFVVFLIGMKINHLFAFSKWLPTMMAMPPMMRSLFQNPEKGFLGGYTFLHGRGIGVVQYWQSFEDLEKFARNPSDPHLKAWRNFNQSVGSDGSVGIWHETYMIEPGHYEALYINMPAFGLASATEHVAIASRHSTARERVNQSGKPTSAYSNSGTIDSEIESG